VSALAPSTPRQSLSRRLFPGNAAHQVKLSVRLHAAEAGDAVRPRVLLHTIIALLYLKHAFNLSDEAMVE